MGMQKVIERAERNIRQALLDYRKHTDWTYVLDDVSDEFIMQLAKDSSYAKQGLRELFSQSPVWCEDIDALVINGTRTHDPDYDRVYSLARDILWPVIVKTPISSQECSDLEDAIRFFADPSLRQSERHIDAINRLAPKAYVPGKKLSRVFKTLCKNLGVADEAAGSEFQRLYAQFADELTSRKIGFKLYVSINPAHFLTMSNPKCDQRGNTLTSCHSFNSTEYSYNNGCSGYARDNYTFIVFTVDDPANPETLNNRKTTRQIFAYKPGNGLLLQSRMYNTSGGVHGAAEGSALYRDLVQREISMLEGKPNLWKTCNFVGSGLEGYISAHKDFGGYKDWTFVDFDAHISVRNDRAGDFENFYIGEAGLCICCGEEISSGLYCDRCYDPEVDENHCEHCEEYTRGNVYEVHDSRGNTLMVCEDCCERYYTRCEDCEEWFPDEMVHEVANGAMVCDRCLVDYCCCEDCGKFYDYDDVYRVHNESGYEVNVCCNCLDDNYTKCADCGEYHANECINRVYHENGEAVWVCDDCTDEYEECSHCGELVKVCDDGTCPRCGVAITPDEDCEAEKEADVA